MKPSSMPSLRRVSAGTEAWVMIAGCSISDSTPPSDSAHVQRRSDFRSVRAAGSPPEITQVSIPLNPFICRSASWYCGCSGRPGHAPRVLLVPLHPHVQRLQAAQDEEAVHRPELRADRVLQEGELLVQVV